MSEKVVEDSEVVDDTSYVIITELGINTRVGYNLINKIRDILLGINLNLVSTEYDSRLKLMESVDVFLHAIDINSTTVADINSKFYKHKIEGSYRSIINEDIIKGLQRYSVVIDYLIKDLMEHIKDLMESIEEIVSWRDKSELSAMLDTVKSELIILKESIDKEKLSDTCIFSLGRQLGKTDAWTAKKMNMYNEGQETELLVRWEIDNEEPEYQENVTGADSGVMNDNSNPLDTKLVLEVLKKRKIK